MDKLVFTALNTLSAQRFERQSITNELANLSTVGFKKSYETALETLKVSGGGFDSRFLTRIVEVDIINMKPGTPMATGRALDVMMNDATVLGVQAEDGSLAFTRRGDLRINDAGLVENGAGDLVLEAGGGPRPFPRAAWCPSGLTDQFTPPIPWRRRRLLFPWVSFIFAIAVKRAWSGVAMGCSRPSRRIASVTVISLSGTACFPLPPALSKARMRLRWTPWSG